MAYCTYTDLQNQGAPSTISTAQLTAIIVDADREIAAYLVANGVSAPTSSDACTVASISLSKARILEFAVLSGQYIQSSGEMVGGSDPNAAGAVNSAIRSLKKEAYEVLDRYITAQSTNPGSIWVSRVRSRCR